jgi:hypothetical protein
MVGGFYAQFERMVKQISARGAFSGDSDSSRYKAHRCIMPRPSESVSNGLAPFRVRTCLLNVLAVNYRHNTNLKK